MGLYYVPWQLTHIQGIACWRDDTLHPQPLSAKTFKEAKKEVRDKYEKEKEENLKFKQEVIEYLEDNQGWDEDIKNDLRLKYPKEPKIISMAPVKKYNLDLEGNNRWKKEEAPRVFLVGH